MTNLLDVEKQLELSWLNKPEQWGFTDDGGLIVTAPPGADYFCDPAGKHICASAPFLYTSVQQSFEMTTQLTVEMKNKYDSGCLMLLVDENNWCKLCFEYNGKVPTIVSVVTKDGISDDCNSEIVHVANPYLRIRKEDDCVSFFYSQDGEEWTLVRYFGMRTPSECKAGLVAQSPQGTGSTTHFMNLMVTEAKPESRFGLKAIIFDFDGLIIDTESPWYHAFKDIYQEHGVELSLELWCKNVGTTFDEFNPYVYLETSIQKPLDHGYIKQLSHEKYAVYLGEAKLLPGVLHLLEAAKSRGLRIGLASSSTRDWVHKYLKQQGIFSYFDVIHTADDVKRVKPDPELYTLTLEKLGVAAGEALVFEDSPNGLKAAKAAGIRCVIVPNDVTRNLEFIAHDLRVASLDEIDLGAF
ncbi:HAD-IA family hydrolase [Paenibacillus sp. P36]|uniref:HAD-IA family hydrolase n=1 Tax=Paenibacillus sp. P36 TaxID=3342538 RepID=UPI0038B384CF